MEGNYRGLAEILPAPFNVVLEDDTYKGEMTIGMKFIPNVSFCITVCVHNIYHQMMLNICSLSTLLGCCERGREAMREEGKRCRINMLCDHKHLETQVVEAFLFL